MEGQGTRDRKIFTLAEFLIVIGILFHSLGAIAANADGDVGIGNYFCTYKSLIQTKLI